MPSISLNVFSTIEKAHGRKSNTAYSFREALMKKKLKAVTFSFVDGTAGINGWLKFKNSALLSERDDIFYGTVGEALLSDIRYK